MKDQWNKKYQTAEFVYGKSANAYLVQSKRFFENCHDILDIAFGEGRNAVWLAKSGYQVTAVDISDVALAKARQLEVEHGVKIDLQLNDLISEQWPPANYNSKFDVVAAIFIQFVGSELSKKLFRDIQATTKPGGIVVVQGFTPKQLEYKTGGPPQLENLYTADILRELFAGWEILDLAEYEQDLHEGTGHNGHAALIGLVARKPM